MATGTSGITIYSDIVNQYFNGIDTTNFTKTKSLAQAPTKANIETIVTDLGATSRTLEVSNKNSVTQNSYTNEQCVLFANLVSNYYYYYYYSTASSTEVIGIRPAINKPTIAKLDIKNAKIKLIYSTQSIRNM